MAGGRGHAAEWALLAKPFTAPNDVMQTTIRQTAPESVQESVHPYREENVNGFSPLRGETVDHKPFKSVHGERFRGNDDDPLPF
jgi:hypothetical protein